MINQRWSENRYRRYPFLTNTTQSVYATGLPSSLLADQTAGPLSLGDILGTAPQFGDGLTAQLLYDTLSGWSTVPDIAHLPVVSTQVVTAPVPTVPGQTWLNSYVLVFTGFIQITTPGLYTFNTGTTQPDGSGLWVDSIKVVGTGAPPSSRLVHGAIGLAVGLHPVRIEFYGRLGNSALNVTVTGPGTTAWKYLLTDEAVQLPPPPFGDRLFVDAAIRLRSDFEFWSVNSDQVQLTSMAVTGTAVTVRFDISAAALPGYWLTGTFHTTDPEETVVRLSLTNGTVHPEQGYGWVTIGVPSDAQNFTGVETLDPSTIRLLPNGTAFRIVPANLVRPAPVVLADGASTALDPIVTHAWVMATQLPDYQHASAPLATQAEVVYSCPNHSISLVSVPRPAEAGPVSVTTGFDATVTIHRSSLVLNDQLVDPTIATGYDAIQVGGAPARYLVPGYNCQLTGNLARNQLKINYQLGAGLGASSCTDYAGYTTALRSGYCVRAINGQTGTAGDLPVQAGPGVQLVPDPANHTLTILFSPENVQRAATS